MAVTTGAFARSVQQFAETGDEAAKMAREVGLGAEALQELRFAADRQGVSTADLEKALGSLNNRVGMLRQGQGSLFTALNESNPALAEQLKSAQDTEQAFMAMMTVLGETENAADRAALAQAAFGRSGQSLVRIAEAGADGIAALRDEARQYGNIVSNEAAANSEKFVDATTNLKNALLGVRNNALTPLIERLQPLIQSMSDWIAENQELIQQKIEDTISRIGDAVRTLARLWDNGLIPAILAGVVAFKAINAALAVYTTAMAVGKAATLLFSASIMSVPVFGWILAGITAIIAATVFLIKNWDEVKAVFQRAWGGIVEYAQGVWEFFREFAAWLGDIFAPIGNAIKDRFVAAFQFIRSAAQAMWDFVSPIFDTIASVIDKVGNFLNNREGRTMAEGRAANAERYGMTTRNTAGIEQVSRTESNTRNQLDINMGNLPAGTRARMSGPRNPNIRVNYGAAGAQL